MAQEFNLKLKVNTEELTDTFGVSVFNLLKGDYGITIGNALRRVLLTSIPGAAITNVTY